MRRLSAAAATGGAQAEPLRVEFFDPPLPAEAWARYERAARSYACTRAFIEYFEGAEGASLGVVRAGDGADRGAFLFRLRPDRSARVLCRFAAPPAEVLQAFVEAVLARHPGVRSLETDVVDRLGDPRAVGRPALVLREGVEMRLALPATMAEYEQARGKSFRSNTRGHERRLQRDLPGARVTTVEGPDIPRAWIADVVRLNRQRMAAKNVTSILTPHYEEGIARVARAHGVVTVLRDGDRVFAGVIDIRCGPEVFGWVIAHDDAYGRYRPGTLCQLAAIRHYIGQGARTLHMLHGESGHKRELGGEPAPIASYLVLRSWAALRPADAARLGRQRLAQGARRLVAAADALLARLLPGSRRAPVKELARALVQLPRRLLRRRALPEAR